MTAPFADSILKKSDESSPIVVGIDPNFSLMPEFLRPSSNSGDAIKSALIQFSKTIYHHMWLHNEIFFVVSNWPIMQFQSPSHFFETPWKKMTNNQMCDDLEEMEKNSIDPSLWVRRQN